MSLPESFVESVCVKLTQLTDSMLGGVHLPGTVIPLTTGLCPYTHTHTQVSQLSQAQLLADIITVSYTHLTLPTTPYV